MLVNLYRRLKSIIKSIKIKINSNIYFFLSFLKSIYKNNNSATSNKGAKQRPSNPKGPPFHAGNRCCRGGFVSFNHI